MAPSQGMCQEGTHQGSVWTLLPEKNEDSSPNPATPESRVTSSNHSTYSGASVPSPLKWG